MSLVNGKVGIDIDTPQAPLSFANVAGNKIDFYYSTTTNDRYGIQVQASELRIHSGAAGQSTGGITFGKDNGTTFTEAMRIRNDGKVGIGTAIPSAKLEVSDSNTIKTAIHIDNTSTGGHRWDIASIGSAVSGRVGNLQIRNDSDTLNIVEITGAGNVGIGTTSPSDILQVNQGSDAFRGITIEGTSPALYLKDTQATNAYHIGSNGNYLYFLEDSNQSGGYNNIMAFWDPSNNFIFSLGNVGIGTSNPSQKLHVAGNARVTGAYYDSNNSPGTANQVLVSTVTGTDWVDGSAIPGVPAGSGTLNTIPLWTPDGDTLGNSHITQNTNDIFIPRYLGHTGDGNNYIGFPANDVFNITTAGVQRFRVNADGNIGIGTTSPGEPLTVKTKTDAYFPGIKVEDYNSSMGLYIQNIEGQNSGIGTGRYYNSGSWRSDVTAPTTIRLDGGAIRFYAQSGVTADVNYTPTQRMTILASGNVGIGTTSPASKFEVYGGNSGVNDVDRYIRFKASNGEKRFDFYVGGTGNASSLGMYTSDGTTKNVQIASGGTSYFNGGNVGIGATSPSYKLTAYGSSTNSEIVASFGSANDQNEYTAIGLSGFIASNGATKAGLALKRTGTYGTGELHFLNNNTLDNSDMTLSDSKMMINSSGNVGIGTTSPDFKLDVNGIIRSENSSEVGTLYLGNTAQSQIPGGAIIGQRSPSYSSTGNLLFQVPTWGAGTDYGLTTQMSIEVSTSDTKKATISMIPFGGNVEITNALLSNQENTDVDTGTETVANVAIATYTAAFFDFVIKKTTNVRSGTVYACHDGTNVEFTETSTQDLGDTSDVTLSVDISGGNMRLRATTTSDDWSVKSLIRAI